MSSKCWPFACVFVQIGMLYKLQPFLKKIYNPFTFVSSHTINNVFLIHVHARSWCMLQVNSVIGWLLIDVCTACLILIRNALWETLIGPTCFRGITQWFLSWWTIYTVKANNQDKNSSKLYLPPGGCSWSMVSLMVEFSATKDILKGW